jgi:hypothetical protein
MLRLFDTKCPGWKSIPYTADVKELLHLAKTENVLQGLCLRPGQHLVKYNQNFTRAYMFRIAVTKVQGHEELLLDEVEYAVYLTECNHLAFENEDDLYVHREKTKSVKNVKFAKVFFDGQWQRHDKGLVRLPAKSIGSVRLTMCTLHAVESTKSMQIVEGTRKRKSVNAYRGPECVNACYTTGIMGDIPGLKVLQNLEKRSVRNGFGSDFTIGTILGVMEVFPKSEGRERRVICKAYTKVEHANFDVCFLCRMLETTQIERIKMHMSVWKATTGHQVDIAKWGYFHAWVEREFKNESGPFFKYRAQTDELDVHCVVEVKNFLDVASTIMKPCDRENKELKTSLGALGLYLSCTCMGVCIYRVARHNREFDFCPRLQEEWISRTLQHLHYCLAQYNSIHTPSWLQK